ncbi:cation-transporting P-type ATPase [Micromonospora inaquosa]|uniref:cation-transporting P-type ATPase n=1 Tax=Micromonospora inaquosa TaxID=2203716 RepID=UPI001FC8FE2F|nr:cation-transporting P-type ATPase [Micromonospora inaquosa]
MARQSPRDARGSALPAGHDPRQPVEQHLRDLKTSLDGLSTAQAHQRPAEYGPNELRRQGGTRWWRDLVRQLIHPLACCCGSPPSWPGSPAHPYWQRRSWPSSSSTPCSPSPRNATPNTPSRP